MKKLAIISLSILTVGVVSIFAAHIPSTSPLQANMNFIGRLCLFLGIVSCWLFVVLPYYDEKSNFE